MTISEGFTSHTVFASPAKSSRCEVANCRDISEVKSSCLGESEAVSILLTILLIIVYLLIVKALVTFRNGSGASVSLACYDS